MTDQITVVAARLGRTISETDCTWFTLLTCNTNQSHFKAHLAASNPITGGRVIVNSGLAAALGFDGKWVLHPGQLDAANEIFSPRQDDYDKAEMILDAYEYHTSAAGGAKGAAMLGDEMIDEASRKMALVVSAEGRAAGMTRTKTFEKPQS